MNDYQSIQQQPEISRNRLATVAELVIEDLAAEGAALRARVADLEGDVVTYRDLLQQSLHFSASVTKDRNRYRRFYYDLLNEQRASGQRAA